jgi:hypothetical protein
VHAELCRDVAYEAFRRDARINRHELWATLETVNSAAPRLVVDLMSGPAVWWAWWSLGAEVVGISAAPDWPGAGFSGDRLPAGVTGVAGDSLVPATRTRVLSALAGRQIDLLVLGGANSEDGVRADFQAYVPLVRPRGMVLVHGVANRRYPGIGRFWSSVAAPGSRLLVGSMDPDGYGVITTPGRETADHG